MAITQQNTSSATGTASISISAPASITSDDVMICFTSDGASSGTTAAPTGWTADVTAALVGRRTQTYIGVYGRNGIGTGPWSFTGTGAMYGLIVSYRGCDPTLPIEASSIRLNSSGTYGTTAITTAQTNSMIVAMFSEYLSGTTWSAESVATSPTITEYFDSVLNSCGVAIADGIKAGTGTTGASTATPSVASSSVGVLFSLKTSYPIVAAGVTSGEVSGQPAIQPNIANSGITSSGASGQPSVQSSVINLGITTEGVIGSLDLSSGITAVGILSNETFGVLTLVWAQYILMIGISSSESFGAVTILARAFSLVKYGLIKYNQGIYNMPIGEYTVDTIPTTPYS